MERALDVGVVGCGTAGAGAALFLARAGHRVTVCERVASPGAVGAGIVLQPTGQAVLARLGLLESILRKAARLEGLTCVTSAGRTVFDLSYARLGPRLFGLGLHRGVLFEALFDAVREEPRIRLITGASIRALRRAPRERVELVDERSEALGTYDLVVVADGARSLLRTATDLTESAEQYPWGALWFLGKDHEQRFQGRLFQTVSGTQKMVGLLPTGVGPRGESDGAYVSLYYSLRVDAFESFREAPLAAWKDEVLALCPTAGPVLDQIGSASDVTLATYHDVVLRRWHSVNTVFLGDAAHAMSPQLGQGANLALVDAFALSQAILTQPTVPQALAAYSALRADNLDFYQRATRWLTPFFQSDATWLSLLRDTAVPLMGKLGFFEREMISTMTGAKRGVFSSDRALEDAR